MAHAPSARPSRAGTQKKGLYLSTRPFLLRTDQPILITAQSSPFPDPFTTPVTHGRQPRGDPHIVARVTKQ
jgi:hypothetical protein